MKRSLLLTAIVVLVALILLARTTCEKSAAVAPVEQDPANPTATTVPGVHPPRVSFPTRTPRVTYLPNTKAVADWLDIMNGGEWRWYRSDVEFKIGFELYLKTCVQMPPDTMVDYILRCYRVEEGSEEFVCTIETDPINAGARTVKVTDAQWGTFSACAHDYLASHTWSSEDYPNDTITWGSGTYFPIGGDRLYTRLKSMGVEIPGL